MLKFAKMIRLYVYSLLLLVQLSLKATCKNPARNDSLRVIFRLDDVLLSDQPIVDSIICIFNEKKVGLNVGIIPFYREHQGVSVSHHKLKLLKSLSQTGIIEIHQHGVYHLKNGADEFSGDNEEIQLKKISAGKHFLDSVLKLNITVFSPAWNSYNMQTPEVLKKAGFLAVSANVFAPVKDVGLSYIPVTVNNISDLMAAYESGKYQPGTICVMLHATDFADPEGLAKLRVILDQWVLTGGKGHLFSQVAGGNDYDFKQMRRYQIPLLRYGRKIGMNFYNDNIYAPQSLIKWLWIQWLLLLAGVLLLITTVKIGQQFFRVKKK